MVKGTRSVLVTGADSGVGLAVTKALAEHAKTNSNLGVVIAAAKAGVANHDLSSLAKTNSKVKVVKLDLMDYKSFSTFAKEVQSKLHEAGVEHLSALVNTAALHYNSTLDNVTASQMMDAFAINAVSPLMLVKALSKQLEKSAQVAGVSGTESVAGGFIFARAQGSCVSENTSSNLASTVSMVGGAEIQASGPAGASHIFAAGVSAHSGHHSIMSGSTRDVTAKFGQGGSNSGAIVAGQNGLAFSGSGAGAVVINTTSGLSSMAGNYQGNFYAYRASKAALNMVTKNIANDLQPKGVLAYSMNIDTAACLSESCSQTENVSGFGADKVAKGVMALLNGANHQMNGDMINVDGAPLHF